MGMYNLKQFANNRINFLKVCLLVVMTFIMLSPTNILAQGTKGSVKGTVTDADTKKPLIGATVSIPELRLGGITDDKGKFSFEVPVGTHTIQIKYIGYEVSKRKIVVRSGDATKFDVELSASDIKTDEIVVTGLTGEVDKNKLGNVISSIGGNDISKVVSSSAIDAISGKVSGVNVTKNSGTPGAGTYITIRGRKSIEGSSEPLYVVDGIIIDNSYIYDGSGQVQLGNRATDINSEDIESMEILKGASAAAIYGSRAANGVIIITTKRGKLTSYDKPATISFTSNYQFDQKAGRFPLQKTYGQKKGTNTTWDYKIDTSVAATRLSISKKLADTVKTYDQDEVPFRTGFSNEQSLSISGGVPQFDYHINGTVLSNEGYVIGSILKRTSLRANIGATILPGLSIQTNNNFITSDNNLPQDGSNVSGILLGALRTPPEFDNTTYLNSDGSQHKFAAYDNPLWTQYNNKFKSKIDRFLQSTELKWQPLEFISFNARYGYDTYEWDNSTRLAVGAGNSDAGLGYISYTSNNNKQQNLDFTATLQHKEFDDLLDMALVLGSQTIWYTNTSINANANTTLEYFDQISAGASKSGASSRYESKSVGFFAQLTSTFDKKYSLTLALRRDGSSTFGESQQYNYYPKVSGSYLLSDESFFKPMKSIFNYARLRGSWGEAGSPSVPGIYATNFLYGTAGFFDPWDRNTETAGRGGFSGIRQGGGTSDAYIVAGAKDILPERTSEREFGIDFSLLDNFLTFEATWYHTNIFDMVLSVDAPSSSGYDKVLANAASMWNEGYELMIKANLVKSEYFNWNTAFTYSRNYNLVTSLFNPVTGKDIDFYQITGGFTGTTNIAKKGSPLGVIYAYGWLRDENNKYLYSGDKIVLDKDGNYKRTANGGVERFTGQQLAAGETSYTLADYYGSSMKKIYGTALLHAPIKDDSRRIVGDPNPKFQLGWKNEINVTKDFTISFLVEGVFGFDVWNGTQGALYRFGTSADNEDRDAPWFNFDGTPVTTADGKQVSRLQYYATYANGFNINEPHIQDGSFVKLREINLEYRFHGLKEWNISTIAVNFSARNLLTFTNYKGYDPEVNTFSNAEGRGIDYFSLPQVKSYRLGIVVNY